MAEIPDSDSPSPYSSSSLPQFPEDALAPYEEHLPSDVSSVPEHTEDEVDGDEVISFGEDDLDDLDEEEEEEEEEDDDDDDDEGTEGDEGEDGEEDYYEQDLDFDDDLDMRDVDFDFEGFGFPDDDDDDDDDDDERLFVDDYLDFPDEDQYDALHQAFIHQLEHHLAQEHWALRPRSPVMDLPSLAQAARPRDHGDQLVQVEVAGQGIAVGAGAGVIATGGQRRRQRQPPADIIDLTGDDGPDVQVRPNLAGQPNRPARSITQRQSENQRRLRSQSQNVPPRLNRSDGNYVNDQVIVLSSSDDEDQPLRASPRRNLNYHNHQHLHLHPNRHNDNNITGRSARNARFGDQPRQLALAPVPAPIQAHHPNNANSSNNNNNNNNINPNSLSGRLRPFTQIVQNIPLFQFLSSPQIMANRNHNPDDDIVITGERNVGNLANLGPLPGQHQYLGLAPVHLDYGAHPFPAMQAPAPPVAGAGPPKPAHEPPNPARPGFTRDTGEDVVAICPSCDQELAYNPEGDDNPSATPTKKPRSKKAMAEHHFWAVKACGHVYCKRCFDNRRSSSKSNIQVGFRPDDLPSKKLFCAVEDCDSEVGTKTAWVGIFM
ncbi:hypothetical protein F5Y12DRAFT_286410 [Xylaria sp. FL1777]|nr:hypothetical protein F5Y12DRAFT_286410 [Xylaria sp. FL1777]